MIMKLFLAAETNVIQQFFQKVSDFFINIYDKLHYALIVKGGFGFIAEGLGNTLLISITSLIIGVAIGILVAIIKIDNSKGFFAKLLKLVSNVYISVIRGTPIVVQLLVSYFVIFPLFNKHTPAIFIAIFAFGMNSGAYVAEIIRSGILAVDKGQTEAGRSLGLPQSKTMRLIILPQAIKNILPALGNEFIALIKETSVAGYITIMDLTRAAQSITGVTYDFFTPYLLISAIYLIIVLILTKLLTIFEGRLRRSDNR